MRASVCGAIATNELAEAVAAIETPTVAKLGVATVVREAGGAMRGAWAQVSRKSRQPMRKEIGLGVLRERKVESVGHSKTETTEKMELETGIKGGAEEIPEAQVTLKSPHQLPVVPRRQRPEIARGEIGKRNPREEDGEVPVAMALVGWTEKED